MSLSHCRHQAVPPRPAAWPSRDVLPDSSGLPSVALLRERGRAEKRGVRLIALDILRVHDRRDGNEVVTVAEEAPGLQDLVGLDLIVCLVDDLIARLGALLIRCQRALVDILALDLSTNQL